MGLWPELMSTLRECLRLQELIYRFSAAVTGLAQNWQSKPRLWYVIYNVLFNILLSNKRLMINSLHWTFSVCLAYVENFKISFIRYNIEELCWDGLIDKQTAQHHWLHTDTLTHNCRIDQNSNARDTHHQ